MIPDISTLWVVLLLLLCTVILNTLIFQPILRIIDARSNAVRGARELAESASTKATAAAAEYDRKLNAARADVYAQLDETRRAALEKRALVLADTRQTVERDTQAATAQVAQESAAARASLDREATDLANAIVTRVLDRAS
jgi:F0F1-type ATP synthase membrane subunit b/b'